jgi:penicillin-binding protein 1A
MIRLSKILLGALFAGLTTLVLAVIGVYLFLAPDLPSIESLRDTRLQVPLRVYARSGELIAEYGEYRRIPVAFDDMPPLVEDAFLAAEDDRFWEHPGVDYQGLIRAAVELALTGEKRQGGSTITMQVARNIFLSSEKTYKRKLLEIFLALKIERELSKREIFELYLNKIYLGNRAYGVAAAAQVYYGKNLADLTSAQTAMIAGLPKAPSRFNPLANPERALLRRNYVLRRMKELDFIDEATYEQATQEPVTAQLHTAEVVPGGQYLGEMVRSDLYERFGDTIYTEGFSVATTLDADLQAAAVWALRDTLLDYDRRHGWRGATAHIDLPQDGSDPFAEGLVEADITGGLVRGVVVDVEEKTATVLLPDELRVEIPWEGLEWAVAYRGVNSRGKAPEQAADVLSVGDVVRVEPREGGTFWLAQVPQVEGAFVAISPLDGAILAMVGGFDFFKSKFNRAVQAERQTGSGFKPFIYSAALENGFTTASLINDAPVVFDDPALEATWRPENYSGRFYGPTRLREALVKSRNLVSIRLLRAIDVGPAIRHAAKFGFDPALLPRDLSLALGSCTQTPLAMARGYAVFANGGFLIEPYYIESLDDADGQVIESAHPVIACEDEGCEQYIQERAAAARQPETEPESEEAQTAENVTEQETAQDSGEADAEQEQAQAGDQGEAGQQPGEQSGEQDSEQGTDTAAVTPAPRVISPENRFLMVSMMKDVVRRGTAARVYRDLPRRDLAGKTGTTNDQHDAWFNGYNEKIVGIAWVGFDRHQPLGRGETGGRAALPMWLAFMRTALKGTPETDIPPPEGLVTVLIDAETGERAGPASTSTRFELFRPDEVPPKKRLAETAADGQASPETPETVTEDLF